MGTSEHCLQNTGLDKRLSLINENLLHILISSLVERLADTQSSYQCHTSGANIRQYELFIAYTCT